MNSSLFPALTLEQQALIHLCFHIIKGFCLTLLILQLTFIHTNSKIQVIWKSLFCNIQSFIQLSVEYTQLSIFLRTVTSAIRRRQIQRKTRKDNREEDIWTLHNQQIKNTHTSAKKEADLSETTNDSPREASGSLPIQNNVVK